MNTLSILLQVNTASGGNVHQAADEFVKLDPSGIGMTMISMTVVFTVLAIIFIIYKLLSRILNKKAKAKTQVDLTIEQSKKPETTGDMSAEVGAAIATALHMYSLSMHDMDSLTLTIQKVSRMYSPWSSKIYTLRQLPR